MLLSPNQLPATTNTYHSTFGGGGSLAASIKNHWNLHIQWFQFLPSSWLCSPCSLHVSHVEFDPNNMVVWYKMTKQTFNTFKTNLFFFYFQIYLIALPPSHNTYPWLQLNGSTMIAKNGICVWENEFLVPYLTRFISMN